MLKVWRNFDINIQVKTRLITKPFGQWRPIVLTHLKKKSHKDNFRYYFNSQETQHININLLLKQVGRYHWLKRYVILLLFYLIQLAFGQVLLS